MLKMMTFDPQKRITAAQALQHPYFDGFVLNVNPGQNVANSSNKNFFNPNNDIRGVPSSKSKRIESRKGILSRKDSINKNSFY